MVDVETVRSFAKKLLMQCVHIPVPLTPYSGIGDQLLRNTHLSELFNTWDQVQNVNG